MEEVDVLKAELASLRDQLAEARVIIQKSDRARHKAWILLNTAVARLHAYSPKRDGWLLEQSDLWMKENRESWLPPPPADKGRCDYVHPVKGGLAQCLKIQGHADDHSSIPAPGAESGRTNEKGGSDGNNS
jgi:hypothetical protein